VNIRREGSAVASEVDIRENRDFIRWCPLCRCGGGGGTGDPASAVGIVVTWLDATVGTAAAAVPVSAVRVSPPTAMAPAVATTRTRRTEVGLLRKSRPAGGTAPGEIIRSGAPVLAFPVEVLVPSTIPMARSIGRCGHLGRDDHFPLPD
jgi:hypothetical protein